MAKAKTQSDKVRIIVEPATDNADREGYCKVNGKVIPYGVPYTVTQNDLRAIERMKEHRVIREKNDPRAIMERMQITQEKANRIARMSEKEGMGGSVRFVRKYHVRVI